MSIVGDAYARPLVEELRRRPVRPGVAADDRHRRGGHQRAATRRRSSSCCPHAHDRRRLRRLGDRRHGLRRPEPRRRGPTASRPAPGPRWCRPTGPRPGLEPGDDEIGWTARRGRVPLGYLGDRGRHRGDVPDRRRRAAGDPRRPGPAARADGTIRMLGRDSMVVNTGGEKVFVEEVEAVLRPHPDVADALVVGRPSRALRPGGRRRGGAERRARASTPASCGSSSPPTSPGSRRRGPWPCATAVRRHANGKADYRWAQEARHAAPRSTPPVPAADGPRRPRPRLPRLRRHGRHGPGRGPGAGGRRCRGWRSSAGVGSGPRRRAARSCPTATGAHAVVGRWSGDLTERGRGRGRSWRRPSSGWAGCGGWPSRPGSGCAASATCSAAPTTDWAATFDDVLLATVRACRAAVPAWSTGAGARS